MVGSEASARAVHSVMSSAANSPRPFILRCWCAVMVDPLFGCDRPEARSTGSRRLERMPLCLDDGIGGHARWLVIAVGWTIVDSLEARRSEGGRRMMVRAEVTLARSDRPGSRPLEPRLWSRRIWRWSSPVRSIPLARLSSEGPPPRSYARLRQVALFVHTCSGSSHSSWRWSVTRTAGFRKPVFAYVVERADVHALAFTGIPLLWTLAPSSRTWPSACCCTCSWHSRRGACATDLDRVAVGAVYAYIVGFEALGVGPGVPDPLRPASAAVPPHAG